MVMLDGTSALMVAAEQGFEEICAMLRPYELNLTRTMEPQRSCWQSGTDTSKLPSPQP